MKNNKKTNLKKEHRSVFHGLYNVGNKEGARGLYRGFSAAAIRECSYSTLNLAGYEPIKELLGVNESYQPLYLKVFAGFTSSGLAALPCNPTDLLKVRMQAD